MRYEDEFQVTILGEIKYFVRQQFHKVAPALRDLAQFLGSELPEAVTHNDQVAMLQRLVEFEQSRANAFHCALDQKSTVFDDQAEIMKRFGQTTEGLNTPQLLLYFGGIQDQIFQKHDKVTYDTWQNAFVKIMGFAIAGLYSLGVDPAEAWDEAYDTDSLVIIPDESGPEEGPE